MGRSDELEALRNAGNVRSKSTSLSKAASIHGFTSPEAEAEKQRRRLEKTKSARLDAANALRQGARGAGLGDLNLLYNKLITEQREKRREAERIQREWRKKYRGAGKGGGEEGEDAPPPPTAEEMSVNEEAVEMLPEHVVAVLKARYETEDAAVALSQALKEESEAEGKGRLAELMEVPSPTKGVKEAPFDEEADIEEEEEGKKPEPEKEEEPKPEPIAEEPTEEEPKEDEPKEEKPKEDEPKEEESKEDEPKEDEPKEEEPKEEKPKEDEPKEEKPKEEEPKEEEPKEEEPKEEEPKEEEPKEEEPKEEESKEEEPKAEEQAPKPDPSEVDGVDATRRFYDTHTQEFVDNISPRLALTPTSHREAFIAHVHLQQLMNTDDPTTILDAGCGYGRDALFFSERGHSVLGVDFSVGMLERARRLAPKAHYLRTDLRRLGGLLMDGTVDGVWAHASLSHLPKEDAPDVLRELCAAARTGGVLFLSLKMASEGDDGREIRVDERYGKLPGDVGDASDSRMKLYCYYSMEEVNNLLVNAGWEVMEMGEDDRRGSSDYVTHSMIYAFATKK